MASLTRLLADFPLAPFADRRGLLLAIGRAAAAPLTMGQFGGTPESAEACVVDVDGDVHVVDRPSGLMLAARTLSMTLYEAQPVQDGAGGVSYAVMYEAGPQLKTLARGATPEEATSTACTHLEQLVGTLVLSVSDWVAGQLHAGFDAKPARATRKRSAPALARVGEVCFVGNRVETGVYRWEREGDWNPNEIRLDEAIRGLETSSTLRRLESRKPRYSLRLVNVDGEWFSNYHDLVNAARAGFFVEGLRPWPNVSANVFVIGRNFFRYMRERGWRQPWRDESDVGALNLHGRHWHRAEPLPML